MEHICSRTDTIEKIEETLENHIKIQLESDKERMQYRANRKEHDDLIADSLNTMAANISELLELNKEVKDFKTAMRVGRSIGFGLAALIGVMGIIIGGVLAVKEWIKK